MLNGPWQTAHTYNIYAHPAAKQRARVHKYMREQWGHTACIHLIFGHVFVTQHTSNASACDFSGFQSSLRIYRRGSLRDNTSDSIQKHSSVSAVCAMCCYWERSSRNAALSAIPLEIDHQKSTDNYLTNLCVTHSHIHTRTQHARHNLIHTTRSTKALYPGRNPAAQLPHETRDPARE